MQRKDRKRIALSRETVRHLGVDVLGGVAGGRINLSRQTQCDCPTLGGCGPNTVTVSAANTSCTQG